MSETAQTNDPIETVKPRAIDIWPDAAEMFGITDRTTAYKAAAKGLMGPLIATGARRRKVSRDWIERKLSALE